LKPFGYSAKPFFLLSSQETWLQSFQGRLQGRGNVAKINRSQQQTLERLAAFGIVMMNVFLCVHCFE
jgi:hypothetical protein